MQLALSEASTTPGVILPGLVSCYEFHNPNCVLNNGALIRDLCNSSNTGTATTPIYAYNPNTGSMNINHSANSLWNCGNVGLTTLPAISILVWCNYTGGGGTAGTFVADGNAGARNFQFGVNNNAGGHTSMEWYNTSIGEYYSNNVASVAGWHFWAITAPASSLRWFQDGVFVNSVGTSANAGTTAGTVLTIGYDFYSNYFYGLIHSVYIYNRAISDTEVLYNYNATKWRFGL